MNTTRIGDMVKGIDVVETLTSEDSVIRTIFAVTSLDPCKRIIPTSSLQLLLISITESASITTIVSPILITQSTGPFP
ncbi:uncharacterized protein OCT59_025314 [Rhizophagus irregularis]|uniref:uncharacterized protein n=1 Tax=Rhizophagus irregularis TaxID=588596 RepID=UPI00331DA910|nr:hypothetical protein OCT59_025314 [Rhizophagus irregularis]